MAKHKFDGAEQDAINIALDVAQQYLDEGLDPGRPLPTVISPEQRSAVNVLNAAADRANVRGAYDSVADLRNALGSVAAEPPDVPGPTDSLV